MLVSQIKLTRYNFSNLQLTGDFFNRPGTKRCFNVLSMRGHISYGRRAASVHVPVFDNIGRCPARHRTIFITLLIARLTMIMTMHYYMLICTKALPLIDRTRFIVLTVHVHVSHNIISPYSLSKSLTCQMFIFIL